MNQVVAASLEKRDSFYPSHRSIFQTHVPCVPAQTMQVYLTLAAALVPHAAEELPGK